MQKVRLDLNSFIRVVIRGAFTIDSSTPALTGNLNEHPIFWKILEGKIVLLLLAQNNNGENRKTKNIESVFLYSINNRVKYSKCVGFFNFSLFV
jgi:hypothetical protein